MSARPLSVSALGGVVCVAVAAAALASCGSAGGPTASPFTDSLSCSQPGSANDPRRCDVKVAAEDRTVDFGRNWDLRYVQPRDRVQRDALPAEQATWFGSPPSARCPVVPIPPPLTGLGEQPATGPSLPQNLCARVGAQTCLQSAAFTPSQPAGHQNPVQYLGGTTCVFAAVDPTYALLAQSGYTITGTGFRLPGAATSGTFYAAVPVPSEAQGGWAIPAVEPVAGWSELPSVADILPDGLVEGSALDTFEKLAAYNATLNYLAQVNAFPIDAVLAAYAPAQPIPGGAAAQALPILWEAPVDPDPGLHTHDCVGHRCDAALVPLHLDCQQPRAGTHTIEAQTWGWKGNEDVHVIATATDWVSYDSQGPCRNGAAGGGGDGDGGGGAATCGAFHPSTAACSSHRRPWALDCGEASAPDAPVDACCPIDLPFRCPVEKRCFASEGEALAVCGSACKPCKFSGGPGNDGTGSPARFDGVYADQWNTYYGHWPASSKDPYPPVDWYQASYAVTVKDGKISATLDEVNPGANSYQFGGHLVGNGTVDAEGYASWELYGAFNGQPFAWACGGTIVRGYGGNYDLQGGCGGPCWYWGNGPFERTTCGMEF